MRAIPSSFDRLPRKNDVKAIKLSCRRYTLSAKSTTTKKQRKKPHIQGGSQKKGTPMESAHIDGSQRHRLSSSTGAGACKNNGRQPGRCFDRHRPHQPPALLHSRTHFHPGHGRQAETSPARGS